MERNGLSLRLPFVEGNAMNLICAAAYHILPTDGTPEIAICPFVFLAKKNSSAINVFTQV